MNHVSRNLAAVLIGAALVTGQVVSLRGDQAPPVTVPGIDKPVIVVTGSVTGTENWTSNFYYVLRGAVFVEDGATLNIAAGTRVIGEVGQRRHADRQARRPAERHRHAHGADRLHERSAGRQPRAAATGAASSSTAARRSTSRAARVSAKPTPASTAATNPNDNSGTLRYVRVEFAGVEFSPDNELNGIAFQGVGRGGTYEFIQVHMNRDDALEWFGGTADIKYAVASNAADDSFDWTFGWSGRAQFIAIHAARRRCRQRHRSRQQRVQQQPDCRARTRRSTTSRCAATPTPTRAPKARAPPTFAAARRSRSGTSC